MSKLQKCGLAQTVIEGHFKDSDRVEEGLVVECEGSIQKNLHA